MRVTNAYLGLSFVFLQFLTTVQSSAIDGHGLLSVKSVIEENRYLRSAMKNLEEKFESLSNLVVSQKGAMTKIISARTCDELMRSDPTLESGMHYIDPDGWNTGDSPIYVYCDKLTGETNVLHDSQDKTDVGHCYDEGCYSRPVNYGASMRQMRALMALSSKCDQYIRYDCVNAVFEFNGVQYSWWNDRHGEPKYYWHGNNDAGHTCSCGIDDNCKETTIKCNCDASAPISLNDEGFISNRDHLPITRLSFGRTFVSNSSGQHTLGPLRCSGSVQSSTSGIPSSCADLWLSGESVNGLYQVKANDGSIITVFCDMTKLPEEDGHQTLIGISDVKSNPVYFTAAREAFRFFDTKGTIAYDMTYLNIGNAMNITSGLFTAPRHGIYSFVFSACTGSGGWGQGSIISSLGHDVVLEISAHETGHWSVGSAHLTVELNAGDLVYTTLSNGYFVGNEGHQIHFIGHLLQEF